MAWVSERIAADLRDRTYEHMQGLSLEFFGGKRTGDLISRVSTDTDRICYFLSVYVLDFASDILTLLLTAAILLCLDRPTRPGHAAPLAGDCVSGASRAQPDAARFCAGHAGVGRNDQRAGRYHSRHSRRQGVRPGTPRESSDSARPTIACFAANCRVNALWSFFEPIVSLLTALGLAVVWGYGVVADLPAATI